LRTAIAFSAQTPIGGALSLGGRPANCSHAQRIEHPASVDWFDGLCPSQVIDEVPVAGDCLLPSGERTVDARRTAAQFSVYLSPLDDEGEERGLGASQGPHK
jgi:hypothetical protein